MNLELGMPVVVSYFESNEELFWKPEMEDFLFMVGTFEGCAFNIANVRFPGVSYAYGFPMQNVHPMPIAMEFLFP